MCQQLLTVNLDEKLNSSKCNLSFEPKIMTVHFLVCSKCYYSISVRLTVILTVEKQTSECHLSKETNTMHIIQMNQEQHAINFGHAFFRRFRQILQESLSMMIL